MSKFEEFLRTPKVGHLAVVLIRGDCVYDHKFFIQSTPILKLLSPRSPVPTILHGTYQLDGQICIKFGVVGPIDTMEFLAREGIEIFS